MYENVNKGKKYIDKSTPPHQTYTATNIYQLHVAKLTLQPPDIIIAVFINPRRSHNESNTSLIPRLVIYDIVTNYISHI